LRTLVRSRTEFAASSQESHADITRTKNKTRNSTKKRLFYLCQIRPTGKAKFNWIDIKKIGAMISILLEDIDLHKNKEI
jgi:hypothetical protein